MSKILVANWKMNPSAEKDAIKLAKASDSEGVILCPPFPFLKAVKQTIKKARLGAQDICFEETGAFTGEVSGPQLLSLGVSYVIIGHSERRAHAGDTDEIIAKKVAAALASQLIPIVCVGETRSERDNGRTKEVLDKQLRMAFSLIPAGSGHANGEQEKFNAIITYEPVWAISTNQVKLVGAAPQSDTPKAAQDMINYIEGVVRGLPLHPAFLYGGSVTGANLASFLNCQEIHGALVGGASLKPLEFKKMIEIAQNI